MRGRLGRVRLLAVAFALLLVAALFTVGALPNGPGTPRAAAVGDPVIVAAGDIACDPTNKSFNGGNGTSNSCRQQATANLINSINPAAVLPLGDDQYYCGGYNAFLQSYDRSWGAFKSITHPSVGNHEYLTSGGTDCNASNAGANGYFTYFGSAAGQRGQGYYSYDIGSWHLIALNSNCRDAGGCSALSPQGQWLANDLATHQNLCTLAYWHIPPFSSGGRANNNSLALWQQLYNADADLILNGHDHTYERFAPQTPSGQLDNARGIREFVVGTGGANHTSFVSTAPNSEVRNATTFGVLKLTLHPTSYDWQFVPESGKTFTDSGTTACHGATARTPVTPPGTTTGTTHGTTHGGTEQTLRQHARVIRVVDGDTLRARLAGGKKVRVQLLGITAPTTCWGAQASRAARKTLPRHTRILLVSDPTQQLKDRHGRALRYVMKNGRDVDRKLLRTGNARVYVHHHNPFLRVKTYRNAQSNAKHAGRGLWGHC